MAKGHGDHVNSHSISAASVSDFTHSFYLLSFEHCSTTKVRTDIANINTYCRILKLLGIITKSRLISKENQNFYFDIITAQIPYFSQSESDFPGSSL